MMSRQKHLHHLSLIGACIGHGVVRTCGIKFANCFAKHPALNINFKGPASSSASSIHVNRSRQQLTSHSFTLESP